MGIGIEKSDNFQFVREPAGKESRNKYFETPRYLTITPDLKVEVSQRLHNDYGNGKDYYKHHGQPLLIIPGQESQLPSRQFLEWHNEHVYLG